MRNIFLICFVMFITGPESDLLNSVLAASWFLLSLTMADFVIQ